MPNTSIDRDFLIGFSHKTLTFDPEDGPRYADASGQKEQSALLEQINSVFKENGSFDPNSPFSERLALCLIHGKKPQAAAKLFNLIIRNRQDPLLVNTSAMDGCICPPTADQYGQLGFEGMFQYSKLLVWTVPNKAKMFLLEIIQKIPVNYRHTHIDKIRAETLDILKRDLSVHDISHVPVARFLEMFALDKK